MLREPTGLAAIDDRRSADGRSLVWRLHPATPSACPRACHNPVQRIPIDWPRRRARRAIDGGFSLSLWRRNPVRFRLERLGEVQLRARGSSRLAPFSRRARQPHASRSDRLARSGRSPVLLPELATEEVACRHLSRRPTLRSRTFEREVRRGRVLRSRLLGSAHPSCGACCPVVWGSSSDAAPRRDAPPLRATGSPRLPSRPVGSRARASTSRWSAQPWNETPRERHPSRLPCWYHSAQAAAFTAEGSQP